mgnify:CR=1 FL=1
MVGFFNGIADGVDDDEFVSFLLLTTERKPWDCDDGECLMIGDVFSLNISVTEKPVFGFFGSLDKGVFDLDGGDTDRSFLVVIFNLCSCV